MTAPIVNSTAPPSVSTGEVTTVDYHTAGEPFRIVTGGVPDVPGATVAERREAAIATRDVDRVRRLLVNEPRGHADMYGCFLVPPDNDGADLGALFWHKDGFSTACGHGTIALGAWAVESGRVEADPDGETTVTIDVPSGRVAARVRCRGGAVEAVTFVNVAAFVLARDVKVSTETAEVAVDVAFGGAIYASVPASALGLAVTPEHYSALITAGRQIKRALDGTTSAQHPSDPRLSGVYGTILYDDLGESAPGRRQRNPFRTVHQRNVTVFADGEVDRSPCGSGTSARLAILDADGRTPGGPDGGALLRHDSLIGSTFYGRITGRLQIEGRPAVSTEVEGTAFRTGRHTFTLDPRDPLGTGFVLR